jgi:hypothetical protein
VAKPDVHYLCWYLPEVNGNEPDFLVYCEEVGLVVFELKDWVLRQIEEADPNEFLLRIKGKTESRKNPLWAGFFTLHFSGLTYLMTVSTMQKIQKRIFISKEKGLGWATCSHQSP